MEKSLVSKRRFWDGLVLYLFFFILAPHLFSQEKKPLDYEKIQRLETIALGKRDSSKLRRLSEVHASKAKQENNDIEVARAFYYRVFIEEKELAMSYSDSIILVTEKSRHPNFPTIGYILRGNLHYESDNFQQALKDYLKAYNLAFEKNNKEHQWEISTAIAAVRNINGQHLAAADLYRRALNILIDRDNFEVTHYDDYIILLYNLALSHLRMSQLDSAQYYIKKGIELTRSTDNPSDLRDFVLVGAQTDYYRKDYVKARDTLLKYTDDLEGTSKAIKLYYLGRINKALEYDDLAIHYFREVDSIVSITGDPFEEVKSVYHQLAIHESLQGKTGKQVEYLGKLIYYDSLLAANREGVSNQATIAFDIPYLKHQKEKAEEQLRLKNAVNYVIGLLAFTAVGTGIYLYSRTRTIKRRLKIFLEKGPAVPKPLPKAQQAHPSSVPPEIRNDILTKLEAFEESRLYLSKDLDMYFLAQKFSTNTAYLSIVVNHYKKMTFPQYLNDLRISNAVKRLNEEPDWLKYSNQGLAEEFGFKTAKSFSKAFQAKTGVQASKFMGKLKTRRN